jgi:prolyl oligopeptidase
MPIPIDRRRLLAGGVSALALAPLIRALPARAAGALKPPVARVEVVHDTYFGETLSDPYRWMENASDPDWLPFLKAQNAYARAVLDALPGRAALASRIAALSGDSVLTAEIQRAGGKLFYQQRPAGADNYKLFVREDGRDKVLIDPTALAHGTAGHVSLDWWRASPDGSHVVYGLSPNGSENSVLHVLNVADGADLPEHIADTQQAEPYWLDDGSGFFYNQLTGAVATPERFLDSRARFHRLHTDPAADPILAQRGLPGSPAYDRIESPVIVTFSGAQYALLVLVDIRPEQRMLIAPIDDVLAGRAQWHQIADFADEVTAADIHNDTLYLIANHGSPLGRVVTLPLPHGSLAHAKTVVKQGKQVIEEFARAQDGLYLKIMDGGLSRLRRLGNDGKVTEIALPFAGAIASMAAEPDSPGLLISLNGWLTTPTAIWSVTPDGHITDTGLTPPLAIDVSAYQAQRFFATAKDGTKIPYDLIHRKGIKLDGANPAFISAYGSYGLSAYTPAFNARTLAFIDAGGIIGYAHVRGGGEYGRPWHEAGQLFNKPNTWRDLIAVCEQLCAQKYTAPAHLAIGGRSAGGITVGRAMTERPELFAAVIDGVGWSNPLRYVAEQDSYAEEPEWGAIRDPDGYKALKLIDSYQAVRDHTPYPAVLLTTGVTDPRVAPFHVAKMTARLQAATSSGKPILLRVDFDAGHGMGSTRAQQDAEAVDTYAFLLWRTGKPA